MPDDQRPSTAELSLAMCSLFESEILVWLLLKQWTHPYSEDETFRISLLETATDVLRSASEAGHAEAEFIVGLPNTDMNLVAAIWYAENVALEERDAISTDLERGQREAWLDKLRKTFPSCFCPSDRLPPND